MVLCEVQINQQAPVLGGGEGIELLTATVVGSQPDSVWLGLNGGRTLADDVWEQLQWVSTPVQSGDCIIITPRRSGHVATPLNASRTKIAPTALEEKLKRMKSDLEALRGTQRLRLPDLPRRPLSFEINRANEPPIVAGLGQEDQLQVVVTLHRGNNQAIVEVDALTVIEGGYTKGRRWFEAQLQTEESLFIRILESKGPSSESKGPGSN